MQKKFLIFIFSVFIIFVGSGFAVNCNLESNNCSTITSSFVNFSITSNYSDFSFIKANLYQKGNPSNLINLKIGKNWIINKVPFTIPGVYKLNILGFNKAGLKSAELNYSFIFNNLEPSPPFVRLNINLISKTLVTGSVYGTNLSIFAIINGIKINSVKVSNSGNFSINLISLKRGINFVEFFSKNKFNVISEPIKRIIVYGNNYHIGFGNAISLKISNLSILNSKTIFENNTYYTENRNFYVSGSAVGSSGSKIYINGQRAFFSNGEFGAIVLLNQGLNNIDIFSGNKSKQIKVYYFPSNFNFVNFNFVKVISNINFQKISGNVTYGNSKLNIYLNGFFIGMIKTSNLGDFNFNLKSLPNFNIKDIQIGQNFLSIIGPESKSISRIFYIDPNKPIIKLLSKLNFIDNSVFAFKISSLAGIKTNSILFKVGNKTFSSSSLNMIGDIFYIKLRNLSQIKNNFSIFVTSNAGLNSTLKGILSLNFKDTLISDIKIDNGKFLGNTLFLPKIGINKITLIPSRFIAFKSIYLDGIRQINYIIEQKGDVILSLNITKPIENLSLVFLNNNHKLFFSNFTIYSPLKKPSFQLNYITTPTTTQNGIIKISGKINDSFFNWTSLYFNSKQNFFRYGNYFETFISNFSSLNVVGKNLGGYTLINSFFSNIFNIVNNLKFSNSIYWNKDNFSVGTVNGTNSVSPILIQNFDGTKFLGLASSPSRIVLPVNERYGIRSSNLHFSLGNFQGVDYSPFSVNPLKIRAFLVKTQNGYEILATGVLNKIINVKFNINGINISSFGICKDIPLPDFSCFSFKSFFNKTDILTGIFTDSFSNSTKINFNLSSALSLSKTYLKILAPTTKIYFSGNNINSISSNFYVQGQYLSSIPVRQISTNGNNCKVDDYNFYCKIVLKNGLNSVKVNLLDTNNNSISKIINITYIAMSAKIILKNISGPEVYFFNSNYYVLKNGFKVLGFVEANSSIRLSINGAEKLIGTRNGNFTTSINLSNYVNELNKKNLTIRLISQGANGSPFFSNSIKIIYNRILKTMIKILVY